MKLNKIVLPLALALVAMLSTTGCRHGFNGRTTYINGQRVPVSPYDQPQTISSLPSAPPYQEPQPPMVKDRAPDAVIPTSTEIDLDRYTQDRDALKNFTVHFKFDSAVVQDREQQNIASVKQVLDTDPNLRLLIEGHCDERGTEEYNRALGERRALALREALAKINLDPMHVKTISYGKDQPVDPGHDEAAWTKNRRGEFILLHPKNPAVQ
jgi:peptidoglycan-associated lipoprotein